MKFLALLLLLATSAKERQKKRFDDKTIGLNDSYENLCVNQVTENVNLQAEILETGNLGIDLPQGTFTTQVIGTDTGRLWGEVRLENYPNELNCHYVVNAGSDCKEIKINLRNVAVEKEASWNKCHDHFQFSWIDSNGLSTSTPPRCTCYGDGCSETLMGVVDLSSLDAT